MPKKLDEKCTYQELANSFGYIQSEAYPDLDIVREHSWIKASSDLPTTERVRATGFKFHLGIDANIVKAQQKEQGLELLAQTWDTAMPHIAEAGGPMVKIIAPESSLERSLHEQGKQMTIYHDDWSSMEPADWYRMLARTEIALEQAGIPPAVPDKTYKTEYDADRPIPGSKYFRYRCDADRKGVANEVSTDAALKRAERSDDPSHNPYASRNGIKDPFEKLDYATILQEERVKLAQEATREADLQGLQDMDFGTEAQQSQPLTSPQTPERTSDKPSGCSLM